MLLSLQKNILRLTTVSMAWLLYATPAHAIRITINPPPEYTDLIQLVEAIGGYLFAIAIPIAVIVIIWAGVKFLMAKGNPNTVSEAKRMLFWAIVGLTIIFIGSGFVTLIKSILQLS